MSPTRACSTSWKSSISSLPAGVMTSRTTTSPWRMPRSCANWMGRSPRMSEDVTIPDTWRASSTTNRARTRWAIIARFASSIDASGAMVTALTRRRSVMTSVAGASSRIGGGLPGRGRVYRSSGFGNECRNGAYSAIAPSALRVGSDAAVGWWPWKNISCRKWSFWPASRGAAGTPDAVPPLVTWRVSRSRSFMAHSVET